MSATAEKKGFRITVNQIVVTVITALIVGVLSFIGSKLVSSLDDIESLQINEAKYSVEMVEIRKIVDNNVVSIGVNTGDGRRLEILITRLEAAVENLEKFAIPNIGSNSGP